MISILRSCLSALTTSLLLLGCSSLDLVVSRYELAPADCEVALTPYERSTGESERLAMGTKVQEGCTYHQAVFTVSDAEPSLTYFKNRGTGCQLKMATSTKPLSEPLKEDPNYVQALEQQDRLLYELVKKLKLKKAALKSVERLKKEGSHPAEWLCKN